MAAFIIYIIRWAVCLTLLYSLFGLFLKRETLHGINRIVLLFVLTGSMVLPFVQVSTKEPNIVTKGREMIERSLTPDPSPTGEGSIYSQDRDVAEELTTPLSRRRGVGGEALILVYLAGLIICWLRYFWQITALLMMIHKSIRIKVEGVPNHVHIVTNPSVKAPCSWMRWIILTPADVNTRAIIKHELAHIRLGHSWDMLLCELTCRMLWFVPFAWMLRQDLRDVHEYQADRRVLQGGIRDEEYQLLLIKKATSTGLQPVVNAFNQSPIKRRFKMMYRKPSRRWVALK
ncbi:MAG: M56 family metallopeptidase, partial [Prevotella sp.]|nr:M56 family metallopeptidase [Prevotella sp.]